MKKICLLNNPLPFVLEINIMINNVVWFGLRPEVCIANNSYYKIIVVYIFSFSFFTSQKTRKYEMFMPLLPLRCVCPCLVICSKNSDQKQPNNYFSVFIYICNFFMQKMVSSNSLKQVSIQSKLFEVESQNFLDLVLV